MLEGDGFSGDLAAEAVCPPNFQPIPGSYSVEIIFPWPS